MNDVSPAKPHWLHSWTPTALGAITILGSVAAGSAAWSNANNRIEALEKSVKSLDQTVKSLRPAPTAKDEQCKEMLNTLTTQISSSMGNRILDLRDLATQMGCIPPPS